MAKQVKKKGASGTRKTQALLGQQLAMPVGFHADDSSVATLRDVVDPGVTTKHLAELTLEQRVELVAQRLALQPSLELAMIGAGMIDKQRAIAEVRN